jgi:hypothetical protein
VGDALAVLLKERRDGDRDKNVVSAIWTSTAPANNQLAQVSLARIYTLRIPANVTTHSV